MYATMHTSDKYQTIVKNSMYFVRIRLCTFKNPKTKIFRLIRREIPLNIYSQNRENERE